MSDDIERNAEHKDSGAPIASGADALANLPPPPLPPPAPSGEAKPKPKRQRKPAANAAAPIVPDAAPPPIDASDAKEPPKSGGDKRDDAPPPEDKAGESPPPECPVTPLGRAEGVYHFLTAAGEILSLSRRDIGGASHLAALFDGHTEWLRKVFPDWGKRSSDEIREAETDGRLAPGFRVSAARDYFMRECAKRGVDDPYSKLRSVGAWRARNGDLILHLGDEVRRIAADGGAESFFEPGCEIDGKIYVARAPEPKPGDVPASPRDVALLHELLGLWNWKAPAEAPRILLGWILAGFLPGALKWSPHIYVTGDSGDGKSTFELLLWSIFGLRAKRSADPSGAYIRQAMQGAARPVLVDEIENKDVGRRADEVIETARLASSESQAATGRGSANGQAQEYELRATFYFSSILHPPMKPQDANRISIFDLRPLSADPDGKKKERITKGIAWAGEIGAKLQRRVIALWPRIDEIRKMYEAAIGKLGRKARVADQYATMLALAHLALDADPYTQDWVDQFVAGLGLEALIERDEAESESQACVSRLLSYSADAYNGGTKRTLGDLLNDVAFVDVGVNNKETLHRALQSHGLRVEDDFFTTAQLEKRKLWSQPIKGPWVVVAHVYDGLDQVFRGTRWERGVWNQALKRVPGAQVNPERGVRMGGMVRKGVWLPLQAVLTGAAWGVTEDVAAENEGESAPSDPGVTGKAGDGYAGGYGESDGDPMGSAPL